MKNTKIISILLMVLFLFPLSAYTQSQYDFNCGTTASTIPNTPLGMGLTKPMKTLPVNDLTKYFRVLMVFVEFQGDIEGRTDYWPPDGLPLYSNQLFASQKQLGLQAYEQYKISDYFNKISLDQFDVIGDVYHVTLPHEYSYYQNLQNTCFVEAQLDVLRVLDLDVNYRINWSLYDRWSWDPDAQQYVQSGDGNVDMIYIQYRHANMCGIASGGYGDLGVDYTTSDLKHIYGCNICYIGSGVTGINGCNMSLDAVVGYFRHEYCHYGLGDHKPYSTIAGGDHSQYALGYEVGFSPMDMIAVGYDDLHTYNGVENTFTLTDMATTGYILKIPTSTPTEFFLIGNRRRLLNDGAGLTYDCNMAGDTAMGRPFQLFKDYSKGLYIYHVSNGNSFEYMPDLECADGLYNWSISNYTSTPDWDNQQQLPLFEKLSVGYEDDNPNTALSSVSRILSRDGHSLVDYPHYPYEGKWFSVGKRHTMLGENGVDRIFTNKEENVCSRETMGDRWDAWMKGYNEVFSPYSSPNTKDRAGNETGLFIYYENLNGNTATVKVYQGDVNSMNEAVALANTPPSRPMGLTISLTDCINNISYSKLTWNQNMEPDMVRQDGYRMYGIMKAWSNGSSDVPVNYYLVEYVYIPANYQYCEYIDYANEIGCEDLGNNHYTRYKIMAYDVDQNNSVPSDFVSTEALKTWWDPWRKTATSNFPDKFTLKQNYPNPFNPVTEIKYDLPSAANVTIKIYNTLGEEVKTLISNEFKNAGYYSVSFDGSALASGVYFYTITAGEFRDSKKMVLIK